MNEENNKKDTMEQIADSKDATKESNQEKSKTTKSAKQSSKDLLTDEILHNAVVSWFEEEERRLEEEMKNAEPHVFSEEFERKMEEIMRVQKRKSRRSNVIRYAASAAAVVLLVCGLFFVGNEELRASKFRIDVLEWMEDFFVVENDTNRDKNNENDVLFHESQIGYIPEGFEKVEEEVTHSRVCYRYKNQDGEYIGVWVYREKGLSGIDNEKTKIDVSINTYGMEYSYVYKEDTKEHIVTWSDENGKFYSLIGTIAQNEIIKVMNGIMY